MNGTCALALTRERKVADIQARELPGLTTKKAFQVLSKLLAEHAPVQIAAAIAATPFSRGKEDVFSYCGSRRGVLHIIRC